MRGKGVWDGDMGESLRDKRDKEDARRWPGKRGSGGAERRGARGRKKRDILRACILRVLTRVSTKGEAIIAFKRPVTLSTRDQAASL